MGVMYSINISKSIVSAIILFRWVRDDTSELRLSTADAVGNATKAGKNNRAEYTALNIIDTPTMLELPKRKKSIDFESGVMFSEKQSTLKKVKMKNPRADCHTNFFFSRFVRSAIHFVLPIVRRSIIHNTNPAIPASGLFTS